MVFKASHKIDRNLETTVPLLLLISLASPVASNDDPLDVTNLSVATSLLTTGYCGHVLIAVNASYSETFMISAKTRNGSTKDSEHFTRKTDIKILKRVRTQLKIARNHFRNNKEVIARLYTDVKTVMRTDYHYEWLPSQPALIWYKEHVVQLDEDKKVFVLLPALRDSLHNFSVTLRQMRQFNETHYTSNYALRKIILDDLSKHLIAVLCEVETALISLSSRHDRQQWMDGETRTTTAVGGSSWDANPDRTTMLIQDWGVLTIYYRFLKDWLHIVRETVRDQERPKSSVVRRRSPAVSSNVAVAVMGASEDTATAVPSRQQPLPRPLPPRRPFPCIRHWSGRRLVHRVRGVVV